MSELNKNTEKDRDNIVLRVQTENTNLIKECNTLREERKNLKETLKILELKLRNITLELSSATLDGDFRDQESFINE